MEIKEIKLPLLPVKNTVVFPTTSLFLAVGRDKSVAAMKASEGQGGKIIVSAQKSNDTKQEDIGTHNVYSIGTLCQIRNITGSDKTGYQILVTGLSRFKITNISSVDSYFEAEGITYPDVSNESAKAQALFNNVKHISLEVLDILSGSGDSLQTILGQIEKQDELIYLSATYLKMDISKMQEILNIEDIERKMEIILDHLRREREVLLLEKDIKDKVGQRLTQAQRESFLREQLKAIKDELGETDRGDFEGLLKKIQNAKMPKETFEIAKEQFTRLEELPPSSADYHVIRNYLDWLCDMPWNISSEEKIDLEKSEEVLEKHHHGLKKIKKRILEHLAVSQLKGNLKGPIICLMGPPGVGKTSLGKSIAQALGRKFVRASLGGIRDESEIRGHRRTYVGSMPGRIIQSIKRAGTNNPLILLDEIDKLSFGVHGDPASALLEVLDPEQNHTFVDHFLDVPFDLSHTIFVATANRSDTIPEALKDRMEVIELSSYTLNEKHFIAKNFIIPDTLEENGLNEREVIIQEEIIDSLIENYTREAGVRELKRVISSLCRGGAYEIVKGSTKPLIIDEEKINQYLGPAKYLETQRLRKWVPGMATGLAWTPIGGDVLYLECIKIPGKGELKITGQVGDVMKESAELALSFVKSHWSEINTDYTCDNFDIHLHIPAGAIPKDGPSAGITMLTAIASLISEKEVKRELAMTGELTLSGSVLPIGGLKEKVIAAHRNKIKNIILPIQNEKDLHEIPEEIKKDLVFHPVDCVGQVLNLALNIVLRNGSRDLEKFEISHKLL
ncbi:MAG: endopeptidase La [Bacteriovoracaceae bacterium]|jgi:ATP-dependent Lon protease|nr:endopeptidase La [Bacteriovoracaceae bacterium]